MLEPVLHGGTRIVYYGCGARHVWQVRASMWQASMLKHVIFHIFTTPLDDHGVYEAEALLIMVIEEETVLQDGGRGGHRVSNYATRDIRAEQEPMAMGSARAGGSVTSRCCERAIWCGRGDRMGRGTRREFMARERYRERQHIYFKIPPPNDRLHYAFLCFRAPALRSRAGP